MPLIPLGALVAVIAEIVTAQNGEHDESEHKRRVAEWDRKFRCNRCEEVFKASL